MSDFGKPRDCNNGCGGMVYFDAHSSVGHPTADKWVPLEYKGGIKTDAVHQCPNSNSNKRQNGSLNAVTTAATTVTTATNLDVIKAIAAALNDYIAIKEGK